MKFYEDSASTRALVTTLAIVNAVATMILIVVVG